MADLPAVRMRATPVPAEMAIAPELPMSVVRRPPQRHLALLINPFYAKDPRASYGKHVLTPTLALTSIAGATPEHWDVRYWDENLLQGPPPCEPVPLDRGYAWCYDRLFSHASIWRRRPEDSRAVLSYLAMSYLYKRSNRIWHWLIKHRLTGAVWQPLIEHSRRRHLKFRKRVLCMGENDGATSSSRATQYVSPGV